MFLKGLPESFKPFAIHVTHAKDDMTFAEFKTKLRICILVLLFVTVFAQVIVGWNGYNDCPGIPFIPIYLCGPIIAFFALWMYGSCNLLCWSVTTTFFFCWYIAGKL
ncbi:programmed cell death protein 5 [Sarotherodon galilaeus]